jgi:glutamine amidotransferase
MSYRLFAGKADADQILGDDAQLRRKTPELSQMHFSMLASDFDSDAPSLNVSVQPPSPARWKSVADRALVTLTRGDDPQIEAL